MKRHRSALVRRCLDGALVLLRASLLLLWLPALSVAQTPAASDARPAAPGSPAPVPATEPAPTLAPEAAPAPVPAPAPARDPVPVALVLPLESPIYGRAAGAVRAGFTAAAAGAKTRYEVIAHGEGGVVAAFARAREAGARVVVGPLVRDDLKALVVAGGELPWTIALNQLDEGGALPAHVYTLALAVDSEGVQLARSAQADGARSVVVITGDNPLQKRFAGAFTGEWILLGGAVPVTFRFEHAPDMLALLRHEFAKVAPDAVLLALSAQDAALARPYLGRVTAYTSSQVNERLSRESLRDLNDVRFVELPWLADPAAAAFAGIPRPDYGNATLDRLYALGVDAFHVARAFVDGAPTTLQFEGATGRLTLEPSRQFVREGTLLQFRDGEIVPAGGH